MLKRFISAAILLLVSIWLPWYFSVILLAFSCAFFPKFFEGILAAIFLDALHFSPLLFLKAHLGFFTAMFILTIILSEILKYLIQGRNILSKFIIVSANLSVFVAVFLILF